MRRRRLRTSSSDPRRPPGDLRTTNRQDSIDTPALVASSISRNKKFPFLAPSTCTIDLFGPLANRRTLKRLHAGFEFACLLVSYMPLGIAPARTCGSARRVVHLRPRIAACARPTQVLLLQRSRLDRSPLRTLKLFPALCRGNWHCSRDRLL